jgi:integral membrane sensor domain MASE1
VFLGAAVANATTTGTPLGAAALIAAGNTLAGVVGAVGLKRLWQFDAAIRGWRDARAFLLFAVLVTPVLSATNGLLVIRLFHLAQSAALPDVWWIWYSGDALGILVVAPVILVLGSRGLRHPPVRRRIEGVLLGVATVLSCLIVFGLRSADNLFGAGLAFTLFPFVLWAAIRYGMPGAATTTLVVSAAAVIGTVLRQGPFAAQVLHRQLPLLQLFICIVAVTGLVLAVLIEEREDRESRLVRVEARTRAEEELLHAHDDLELASGSAPSWPPPACGCRRRSSGVPASRRSCVPTATSKLVVAADRRWPTPASRVRRPAQVRVPGEHVARATHPLNSIIGFTGILLQG